MRVARSIITTVAVCCSGTVAAVAQTPPAPIAQVHSPAAVFQDQGDELQLAEFQELAQNLRQAESDLASAQAEVARLRTENSSLYDSQFRNASFQQQTGGGGGGAPGGGAAGGGDVATQSQNPVGGLWMLWFQNDMKNMEGPGDGKRIFNTTVFQPVMPIQLTDEWRVINRPVIPVNLFETPNLFKFRPGFSEDAPGINDPFSTSGGIGDLALIQWFSNSPSDSKIVLGVGYDWMFPTGQVDSIGTGKYSVGPSAVGMYLGDEIIAGAIVQQYFSFAGDSDRNRVSLMDIQVVLRYRLTPTTSVGMTPNIQWDQANNDKWTVPIGFGIDTMTFLHKKMPIRFGAEMQYYLSHEHSASRQFDPEWQFRMYISPIIPAPGWAKEPLFD